MLYMRGNHFGNLMVLIGLLVMAPIIVIPVYPNELNHISCFIVPALLSIMLGMSINISIHYSKHTSHFIVLFGWFWGIIIGMLPFLLSGQLNMIQALFESVSGWTTTGLSVMKVDQLPHIFLFYRSFMQFYGGLGFMMMIIMIAFDRESMNLYRAEGHPDKLLPNLRKTVQTIFIMYHVLLVLGTFAYILAGMPVFHAICHAMCALSTGGFSTQLNSIGAYHNMWIEVITMLLMLIGTTNFAVLLLIVQKKWRRIVRVSELKLMLGMLILFVPLVAMSLSESLHISIWSGLRQSSFNIVSALSTAGFSTMDYAKWPPFSLGILIVIMLIGGGMGSTSGGLKITRLYLILRYVINNMKQRISSSRRIYTSYYITAQHKILIDEILMSDVMGFTICYFLIFIMGTLLLTLTAHCSLTEAMFEFASSLGTVGLSIGITSPTTDGWTLSIEIIGMILGRLEIFIIFIALCSTCQYVKRLFR